MRRIVLVSEGARHGRAILADLEHEGFELVERFDLDLSADEDALARGLSGAWGTVAGGEWYTEALLARLPELRLIARAGVGFDHVDVAAATSRGVVVALTPGANTEQVADFTLTLMLAALRRLAAVDAAARSGAWRPPELALDLAGATVAIVGLGQIGRAVTRRLSGFGCRLLGVEPLPDASFCAEHDVTVVSLADALPIADVVTLHVPMTPENRHLLGAAELASMKQTAILVNTARGELVDEGALLVALAGGQLAGAGLDVFELEPLAPGHPLTTVPNVVLGGHVASFSAGAMRAMALGVLENVHALAAGGVPPGCLNPEAL
jgi:glyoxylate reductase